MMKMETILLPWESFLLCLHSQADYMHITTLTSCKLHLSVDFVKWVVLLLGSMWAAGKLMEAHFLILCNFMYLPVKLTDQHSVTYRRWRHPFKRVRGISRKPLHGNYITEVHNYKSDHQGSLHIFTFDQDIVFVTLHVDYINTDIFCMNGCLQLVVLANSVKPLKAIAAPFKDTYQHQVL